MDPHMLMSLISSQFYQDIQAQQNYDNSDSKQDEIEEDKIENDTIEQHTHNVIDEETKEHEPEIIYDQFQIWYLTMPLLEKQQNAKDKLKNYQDKLEDLKSKFVPDPHALVNTFMTIDKQEKLIEKYESELEKLNIQLDLIMCKDRKEEDLPYLII